VAIIAASLAVLALATVQARPAVIILFNGRDESDATEWQPLVGKLLEKAPDPRLALNEIVCRLHPSTWSRSLATVLEQRQRLLSTPPEVKTPVLVTTMAEAKARLQETINAERKREEEEASAREKSRTARPTHHRKNVFNVLSSLWLAWALRCAISLRGRSPPAF
jgi:hypothetical protein